MDRVDDFRIYGYDAGWNDPRVLLEIGRTEYDQYVVIDEYHESESHVEDTVAWLKQNDKPEGTIYSEHNPGDIDKFNTTRWPAEQADKALDGGIDEVRKHFEDDHTGEPGLLISDRCEHLINELQGYKEEHVGTSQAVDHCSDGLRYCLYTHKQGDSFLLLGYE